MAYFAERDNQSFASSIAPTVKGIYMYNVLGILLGRPEIWSVADDRIHGTLNAHCSKRSEKETDSV